MKVSDISARFCWAILLKSGWRRRHQSNAGHSMRSSKRQQIAAGLTSRRSLHHSRKKGNFHHDCIHDYWNGIDDGYIKQFRKYLMKIKAWKKVVKIVPFRVTSKCCETWRDGVKPRNWKRQAEHRCTKKRKKKEKEKNCEEMEKCLCKANRSWRTGSKQWNSLFKSTEFFPLPVRYVQISIHLASGSNFSTI